MTAAADRSAVWRNGILVVEYIMCVEECVWCKDSADESRFGGSLVC